MGAALGGPWQAQHGYGYFVFRLFWAERDKKPKKKFSDFQKTFSSGNEGDGLLNWILKPFSTVLC
tara:strand:+ start:217 stop:411 length:195 start_codon:yes stop_codon:yes gene_type:complete